MSLSKPVKVAYLCEFSTLLGGERSLLAFLQHAKELVSPVVVAPADGPLADALQRLGIERWDWPPGGRRKPEALVPALRRRGIELLHSNSLMVADAAFALAAACGVPYVVHVRDIMNLSQARRERLCAAGGVVAVSEAVADWLRALGVDAGQLRVIYNAVDAEELRRVSVPGSVRRELGIGAEPLVSCVGQIALRKGQDVFVEAAALVLAKIPRVHFALAGERYSQKPESEEFEFAIHERVRCRILQGRVHTLGYRQDVPSLLADSDVVAIPSRQEPLSRVALEALSLGVAVVATDVGGTSEILEGGRCGLLVPPDSPDDIAHAVVRLLTGAERRRQLGQRGEARAQHFSPERQVAAIERLYADLLVRG